MHLKELYRHVNELREKNGLPPLKRGDYLLFIIMWQMEGKIIVSDNGEVCPVKRGKE